MMSFHGKNTLGDQRFKRILGEWHDMGSDHQAVPVELIYSE
ncbi:MAG: hypothetical protein ACE5K4_02985 [Candidatus Hydrothermarchaeota archaeon]